MAQTEQPEKKSDHPDPLPSNAENTDGPSAPKQEKIARHNIENAKQFWRRWVARPIACIVRWIDNHDGVVTAAATVAIAFLTWSLSQDSRRQADIANDQFKIMKGQLDAMEADQRPWIQPKLQILGFRFTKDRGTEITYFLDYKNVGKSPARIIYSRIIANIVTRENNIKSADDEHAQCALARKDSSTSSIPGIILFPDQSAPPLIGGAGAGRAYVTASEYSKAWPGPGKLMFKLIGCIDYSYAYDGHIHGASGFAYSVSKRLPNTPGLQTFFSPDPGNIPVDQIIFEADPFSSGTIE